MQQDEPAQTVYASTKEVMFFTCYSHCIYVSLRCFISYQWIPMEYGRMTDIQQGNRGLDFHYDPDLSLSYFLYDQDKERCFCHFPNPPSQMWVRQTIRNSNVIHHNTTNRGSRSAREQNQQTLWGNVNKNSTRGFNKTAFIQGLSDLWDFTGVPGKLETQRNSLSWSYMFVTLSLTRFNKNEEKWFSLSLLVIQQPWLWAPKVTRDKMIDFFIKNDLMCCYFELSCLLCQVLHEPSRKT